MKFNIPSFLLGVFCVISLVFFTGFKGIAARYLPVSNGSDVYVTDTLTGITLKVTGNDKNLGTSFEELLNQREKSR